MIWAKAKDKPTKRLAEIKGNNSIRIRVWLKDIDFVWRLTRDVMPRIST